MNMDLPLNGDEIKKIRKEWDMSQQQFATLLGVSTRWLFDVEKYNRTPETVYQRALRQLIQERKGAGYLDAMRGPLQVQAA
jgi:DNA-binding transcriptional regulator YiaG